MNPFLGIAPIPGIKKVIAVGSGKGGVGKSTISLNLASALKHQGLQVGLLDADIYGPSIPRLTGTLGQRLTLDPSGKIAPLVRHGIKLMSMGYMVEDDAAVVWRGPMLVKAMDQFFRDVAWGELDFLIIDLPPGTGDVALTLAQKVPVHGAVVVCTPQNLALADAKKAIDMFERIHITPLGIVENMAYLRADDSGTETPLFPPGDLNAYLDAKGLPKLARIPFHPSVALTSEAGIPVMESSPNSPEALAFKELAQKLL